jgi:glycosyltransferase involved in cell wall biosynthesis
MTGAVDAGATSKSVLLIAFHFPPVAGSSGWQRTLRFAQHLPKYGWRPIILTVHPSAYEATQEHGDRPSRDGFEVHRAYALDAARHCSILGRYPRGLAIPDRWMSWQWHAVRMARRLIPRKGVRAVWSTFPIATAHLIGAQVQRLSQLPWIAEFRDPLWQGDYPPDPLVNAAWLELEQRCFDQASAVVVTTRGARDEYIARYPRFRPDRIELIENGYDESSFQRAEAAVDATARSTARPLVLLHSGLVYRSERDPTQLFAALANLKTRGAISASTVNVIFRATGDDVGYRSDIHKFAIDDIVKIESPVDYLGALREMLSVDALLILQASNCNAQVPAKLYEYVRAGKPILALTDQAGDTARTLREIGVGAIARLDSSHDIERAMLPFLESVRQGAAPLAPQSTIARYSREAQAGQFAELLDRVTVQ